MRRIWESVTATGLRDAAGRYASQALLAVVLAAAVWAARLNLDTFLPQVAPLEAGPVATPEALGLGVSMLSLPPLTGAETLGTDDLVRLIELHTDIPSRPRSTVTVYTVEKGDTLFGIAEKFGLVPETLLWGNFLLLKDNPHSLRPGQELNILPVNGTYHLVSAGQSVEDVAKQYGVAAEAIVDWPGNQLDIENPQLIPDTWVVVPGGTRPFTGWPEVPQIDRRRAGRGVPVDAGPGKCDGTYSGAVGVGSFLWPSANRRISGYNFSAYHPGIDIGATVGDAIFAADAGVVVYAGWNNWGYGNLVIIDHGNGWQTLYAHLSQWNVGCGQSMAQGGVIGLAGSTGNSSGPHLHFEMRNAVYGRVNPFNFLI